MNAAEAARKAALIMSERGHCKGTLEDETGAVCYHGALRTALTGSPWAILPFASETWTLNKEVRDASNRLLGERGYSETIDYNDREEISGEDVIMLLKETAEVLEAA